MYEQEVVEYAKTILSDAGCDKYTYGGEWAKFIMNDLKIAYPNGMKYPYIDVANAILAMSRPTPIYRAPYRVVWETPNDCDGCNHESFGAAKADAEDTLINWAAEEASTWENGIPTDEQVESWDYLIYNYGVRIDKYVPERDEYETVWEPDHSELAAIGWDLWDTIK